MLELLVLAAAGTCVGAALGARRHGAPRRLAAACLGLAALALVTAVVLVVTSEHP